MTESTPTPPHRVVDQTRRVRPDAWIDRVVALCAGVVVFAVYLRTLYPGLVDIGDAAKFAFVGRVLGTPHAPGYPLWVMVSHVASYLPWSTLVHRMNALSAFFGACTVAMVFLLARRTGVERTVAAAAALALGFGQSFWSIASYAKTYTLNAFLITLGLWLLLGWGARKRASLFYGAAAIFALSIGNHLTVVALLPALVLYAVLVDARFVLHPKRLVAVAALVLAGLSQYLFILIRTRQGAPYLEARATTLRELWDVMTARRFAHEIGAFSLHDLVRERVPAIANLITGDLGNLGLVLLCIGALVLASRRPRHLALLGTAGVGITLLTVNMGSQEDRGFLLPVFVVGWVLAAVGLQRFAESVRTRASVLRHVVLLIVAGVPAGQLAVNYRINDHHLETFESEYFNALFAELPDRAVFVDDEYRYNMMFLYKLIGEDAARGRHIRLAPLDRGGLEQLRARGDELFALRVARAEMQGYGFAFTRHVAATGAHARLFDARPLYRVTSAPSCSDIGNLGWTDVSAAATPKGRLSIRIDNYRPFDARLTMYAAVDQPPRPALMTSRGPAVPTMGFTVFANDDAGRALLERQARSDALVIPDVMRQAPYVLRVEARVNDRGQFETFAMDLGPVRPPVMASAVVDQDTPKRAVVCSHPLLDTNVWPPPAGITGVEVPLDADAVEFADGWYETERRPDGLKYRWTTSRAVLVMPAAEPEAMVFSLSAEPLPGTRPDASTLTLVVNGHRLETRALPRRRARQTWTVPPGVLRRGLNEVVLDVGGAARPVDMGLGTDTRLLGVSVTDIVLSPPTP